MRIRLVTQWYPPEPAGVPAGIARGLAARGHAVDVLTGFPNYPTGTLVPGYRVRSYRRDEERHAQGDVVVHRAPLFPSHDARALPRMVNYTSFAVAATAVAVTKLPRPDVWLTYSSPATAALPALTAGLMARLPRGRRGQPGCPVAHAQIVQDLWPDSVMAAGFVGDSRVNQAMESALTRYCDYAFAHTDAVGVISPGMRSVLTSRGVPDTAIVDTPNAVDAAALPPLTGEAATARRRELGLPEHGRLFMYAGNLGELQNLPALVDAVGRVPSASLALIGPGVMRDRLDAQIRAAGATNIRLAPAQPPERIGDFLACADVLVVSLADSPLMRVTMPSKVASYLGAARPVLAHAAGDVAQVVEQAGGLSCAPGDPESAAAAVTTMAGWDEAEVARRGTLARAYYEAHMDTERCRDAADTLVRLAFQRAGGQASGARPGRTA